MRLKDRAKAMRPVFERRFQRTIHGRHYRREYSGGRWRWQGRQTCEGMAATSLPSTLGELWFFAVRIRLRVMRLSSTRYDTAAWYVGIRGGKTSPRPPLLPCYLMKAVPLSCTRYVLLLLLILLLPLRLLLVVVLL